MEPNRGHGEDLTPPQDAAYLTETRTHYQTEKVAARYHRAFTKLTLGDIRARLVAQAEKKTIGQMIARVPATSVLDVPAGTGKLAPVFFAHGISPTSVDVSHAMLKVAREEYFNSKTSGPFIVGDATQISRFIRNRHYDLAVCLRLFHRVPLSIVDTVLRELALLADHVIVSFAVSSRYHNARRLLLKPFRDEDSQRTHRPLSTSTIHGLLSRHRLTVVDEAWVLPFVSQERIFLARSEERPAG